MSADDLIAVCYGRIETMIRLDEGERRNLDLAELQAWATTLLALKIDKATPKSCLDVRTWGGNDV